MTTAPAKPKRRRLRLVLRVVLLVIVVALVWLAWSIYQAVNTAFHAEMALHATNEACDLATQYVLEHDGQWPRSWRELEQVKCPPEKHNIFAWPEKSTDLQQFVTIDFAADPEQLAKQTVDEFEAIKPIGPCFGYKGYGHVSSLLESLRASRKAGDPIEAPSQ